MSATSFFYDPGTFVGREEEQRRILELLAEPGCRLLTLLGPGGIGKTRLALQLVQQLQTSFAHGVYFVPLQPVDTAALLISSVAEGVNLSLSGQEPPQTQLFTYLQDKEMLLVLDNFEQLLSAAVILSDLLRAAPHIQLLVTSREGLNLQEEWQYRVPGLSIPPGPQVDDLQTYAAAELFLRRARRVRPDFNLDDERAGVVRICQLLDGMPLAIELASTWLQTLRCAAVAAEIQRSLDFLSSRLRNVPGRHRSMRAVFNHSWKLLSEEEQDVFQRLSVFRGGFRREATVEVAGATLPILSSLVDKSLVIRRETGRYDIHELLRQYGAEKLSRDAKAAAQIRERHCHYYAEFLWQREAAMNGTEQLQTSMEIAGELENVLAAWRWAVSSGDLAAIGRLASSYFFFCQMQSRFLEGADALASAADLLLTLPAGKERDITLAKVFNHEGWLRIRTGKFERARKILAQSRELFAAHQEPPPPYMGADSAVPLGLIYTIKGQHRRAIKLGEEARRSAEQRCDGHGDRHNLSFAHYLLTTARAALGDYEVAYHHAQRACALARQSGNRWFLAYPLNEWGKVACAMGKVAEAEKHFRASLKLKEAFNDKEGMAVALRHLGETALLQAEYGPAERLFRESLDIYRTLNDQGGLAASLKGLAQVAHEQQAYEQARGYLEQALRIAAAIQFVPLTLALLVDAARLLLRRGDPTFGLALFCFVKGHSASDQTTKAQAEQELARWQEEGGDALLSEAAARAQELVLESAVTTMQTILATPLSEQAASSDESPLVEPLTSREREVLGLMAQGYTNPQIAEELVIALGTVKWYASEIYGKLGVSNRTEAVVRGRELGLLS